MATELTCPAIERGIALPENNAAQAPTTGTQARHKQQTGSYYTINAGSIPRELKARPQWLCWKCEERKGKLTKPPYDAKTGKRGKSNDPDTWSSFDVAIAALQNGADYAGIGFAFHAGDGLVGIDIDHVIDPVTGAVDPRALEILEHFKGSYGEVSPSGTGLRIYLKGLLARAGKNEGRVKWLEIYDHTSPRYLTTTGQHWPGTATTVTEQQAALDWLHSQYFAKPTKPATPTTPALAPALALDDAALLEKASNAYNGAKFRALWAGDTSAYGGDNSSADLALCSLLAFWTGKDAGRIDRLFRQSGLMRDKWERADYRERTIAKAITECREVYTGGSKGDQGTITSPGTKTIPDDNLFSDYGNVVKLLARLSDRLAYSPGLDWLLYCPESGVWEPEPCAERVKNLVLETLREAWGAVLDDATRKAVGLKKRRKELDDDTPSMTMLDKQVKSAGVFKDKVVGWLRQCETAYRIRSTLEIAEGYFWTRPETWDANPHILICGNGALNLATGHLLPHSPDYRATKTTGTDYRPGAIHPACTAMVALLQSEGDRYDFIQQYCGSGLHGANPNERLVIFQGDGGTGKGTLLAAVHHAMGDYAQTVEIGSLLATDWRKQNKSAPREDLLKLRGARFVYPSIEPPKDSKLDDGSIKALTGNDAITARYPHARNSITFLPVFKLVIQTNFALRTEFNDPGMKRRVVVIPFNQKPKEPDPAIKNALMHDPDARAAILTWLVDGYRIWRANNFRLPTSDLATTATADYWRDMNPFEQFARDVGLEFKRGAKCVKTHLTGIFKAWREEGGRTDAKPKEFPLWLASMGCTEGWDAKIRMWWNVQFMNEHSLPRSPQSPQSEVVNKVVDFDTPISILEFHETGCVDRGDRGDRGNDPLEFTATEQEPDAGGAVGAADDDSEIW